MSLTFTDVEEILRIIDQFPVAEIRFEHGDLKLFVKRPQAGGSAPQFAAASAPAAPAAAQPAAPPPAHQPPSAADSPALREPEPASAESRDDLDEEIAIKAPLMGVYYAAPSPDADPFVSEGKQVKKGDALCIIEVMKVMNLVKAPWAGVVLQIGVKNGAMVESAQPLMWIQPKGDLE